jgi:hypothetical protein
VVAHSRGGELGVVVSPVVDIDQCHIRFRSFSLLSGAGVYKGEGSGGWRLAEAATITAGQEIQSSINTISRKG